MAIRRLDPAFANGELGFVIGSPFWGRGLFGAAARLVVDFAFNTIGVDRLEARAVVQNTRGNAAIRKLGAVADGILPGGLVRDDKSFDQIQWSIFPQHGVRAKAIWGTRVH